MKKYLVCFWVAGEPMPRNEEIQIQNYIGEKYITAEICDELKRKYWTTYKQAVLMNYWEIL